MGLRFWSVEAAVGVAVLLLFAVSASTGGVACGVV
jgi:hypothetical protein